jgi:hypothetical protein
MLRLRHPDIRVDLDNLAEAPLIENYCLVPQTLDGDSADLVGEFAGQHVRISSVQAIDDEAGWAWAFSRGLVRLGHALDRVLDRTVRL